MVPPWTMEIGHFYIVVYLSDVDESIRFLSCTRSLFECVCVYVFRSSILHSNWYCFRVHRNICVHLHLYPFIRSITLFRAANNNSLLDFVFHFSILCCSSSYYYSQSVWFRYNIVYGSIFHCSTNNTYKHEPLPEALELNEEHWCVSMCLCVLAHGAGVKKHISLRWKHNQAQTVITILEISSTIHSFENQNPLSPMM